MVDLVLAARRADQPATRQFLWGESSLDGIYRRDFLRGCILSQTNEGAEVDCGVARLGPLRILDVCNLGSEPHLVLSDLFTRLNPSLDSHPALCIPVL